MVRRFLRSEIFKVALRYLAAGLVMIPAALLYFEFSGKVGESRAFWLSAIIAVIVGLSASTCVGYFLRPRSAKVFLGPQPEQTSQSGKMSNHLPTFLGL